MNRRLFLALTWVAAAACGQSGKPKFEPALSWRRDGGIVGFCDELDISAAGEFRGKSCKFPQTNSGRISKEELDQLQRWLGDFGKVSIETKDSPAADAVTVAILLAGKGTGQPDDGGKREMLRWAQRVYSQRAASK